MVNDFVLQPNGYVWIATKDGLNRFDGKEVVVFRHNPEDSLSLPGNHIEKLHLDGLGRLWLQFNNGALGYFGLQDFTFHRFILEDKSKSTSLFSVVESDQSLFFLNKTGTLYQVEKQKLNIQKRYQIPEAGKGHLVFKYIKGLLWLVADRLVYTFNPATEEFHKLKLPINGDWHDINQDPRQPEGTIYFNTRDSVFEYKNQQLTFKYRFDEGRLKLAGFVPTHFFQLPIGTYKWLALPWWRPTLIDLPTGQQKPLFNGYLPWDKAVVYKVAQDSSGTIWLSTNKYGLLYFNQRALTLNGTFSGENGFPTLFKHHIFKNYSGPLKELPYYDFEEVAPTLRHLRSSKIAPLVFQSKSEPNKTPPSETIIQSWNRLNAHFGEQLIIVKTLPEIGRYIITTKAGEVYFFQPENDQLIQTNLPLKRYGKGEIWSYQKQGAARCLLFFPSEEVFFIVDPISGKVLETVKFSIELKKYLASFNLKSVYVKGGTVPEIFLGSNGGGIIVASEKGELLRKIRVQEGLPNDVVYGLLPDDDGNLWGSTNKGLFKLELPSEKVFKLSLSDGLQNMEFNTGEYAKLHDGRLYFGGINGINIFNPSEVRFSNYAPKVLLNKVELNGKTYLPNTLISQFASTSAGLPYYHFSYDENNFTFHWMASDYAAPEKLSFRFRLNKSEEFTDLGQNTQLLLASLKPGDYRLEIQASNSDGEWSPKILTFSFTIHRPLWLQWWALLIYFIIVSGVALIIFRGRLKAIKLSNQVSLKQQEAQQLKSLDEVKTRFFSNITHEFRTPLTLIKAPLDRWLQNASAEEKPYLKIIQRNADRLLDLVNQLLYLSKLEAGDLRLKYFQGDLQVFALSLAQEFELLAKNKGLAFNYDLQDTDPKLAVYFDKYLIERCLINLLGNAVKFTTEGEIIFGISRTATHISFTISDTGPGIEPEKLKHIFERFYQGDNALSRSQEGTGIGLALVKEIADLLGAELSVQSTIGQGSTFTLAIPLLFKLPEGAEFAGSLQQQEGKKLENGLTLNEEKEAFILSAEAPTLLIADDNPDIRYLLKNLFQNTYHLLLAEDGDQALQIANTEVPDIIITDVMMPKMDGFTFCHLLKNNTSTSHIPVLMLTAKGSVESKIEGLSTGADHYLPKPFNLQELEILVKNIAHNIKAQQGFWAEKFRQLERVSVPESVENSPQLSSQEEEFLAKLNQTIQANISSPEFGTVELADALAITDRQLRRKTQALTGFSPNELIRQQKVQKAKELLATTSLPIGQIAFELGFSSQAYFSKVFLEETSLRPSEWRDQNTRN